MGQRILKSVLASTLIWATGAGPVWAATVTAPATVSATIPLRADAALTRNASSVTRGTVGQVLFDIYDDQDAGITDGSGSSRFMYAPHRGDEAGKNWHVLTIFTNGTTFTITAAVTGTVGTTPLANILQLFTSGLFGEGATTPVAGTATADAVLWEPLQGFRRQLNGGFRGSMPFNYRLDVGAVRTGTGTGTITFTLTNA